MGNLLSRFVDRYLSNSKPPTLAQQPIKQVKPTELAQKPLKSNHSKSNLKKVDSEGSSPDSKKTRPVLEQGSSQEESKRSAFSNYKFVKKPTPQVGGTPPTISTPQYLPNQTQRG